MRFRCGSRVVGALVVVFLLGGWSAIVAKSVRKLALRDLSGNKTRIGDYQGRVVVLNFWATWCGPCKEEIPRLARISEQYDKQKVTFILASIDEQKKVPAVRDYVAQQKVNLPVWVGASTELLEDLSGINVVPATLIIDEEGEIVRAVNGEAREEDVKEAVDWLLSGRKDPVPQMHLKRY